jgi:hypothetical protein
MHIAAPVVVGHKGRVRQAVGCAMQAHCCMSAASHEAHLRQAAHARHWSHGAQLQVMHALLPRLVQHGASKVAG